MKQITRTADSKPEYEFTAKKTPRPKTEVSLDVFCGAV